MPDRNDPALTHVVTLRDIYDQGQETHESLIRLEGKVENVQRKQDATEQEVTTVKRDVVEVSRRVSSIELDRAKFLGMAAAVAVLSSGGTAGLIQFINNK